MPINKILALSLVLSTCFHFWSFSQQALLPNKSGTNNQWTFSHTNLPTLTQKPNSSPPFYWAFWIFGDGEYAPNGLRPYWQSSDYPTPGSVPIPQPSTTHTYPGFGNSYELVSYLFSRKTEDPPPSALLGDTVTVSQGSTPFNQAKVIPQGKRVFVEHSHGYYQRAGEESVFAVSYLPFASRDSSCDGEVLLFYNAKIAGSNIQPLYVFDKLLQPRVHIPNYGATITPTAAWQDAASFDNNQKTNFRSYYQDVFRWQYSKAYVDAVRTLPRNNDGEFRIFPVLQTSNPPQSDKTIALAVLTSACPIAKYSQLDSARIYSILGIAVHNTNSNSNPLPIGNRWVVDVDTVQLKSGEPTDPNRCTITNICKCSNNKFKISCRLVFANVGQAVANDMHVFLNALGNNRLSFCAIDSLVQVGGQPQYNWYSGDQELQLLSPLNPQDSVVVYFSMIATMMDTSLAGLLRKHPIIGGVVVFPISPGKEEVTGFMNDILEGEDPLLESDKMNEDCKRCSCEKVFFFDRIIAFIRHWWKEIAVVSFLSLWGFAFWKRSTDARVKKAADTPSSETNNG